METSPPKLTGTSRRFVELMLKFFVSVAIGLAPFLGKWDVPGFSALLSVYPTQLHNLLIPLSSLILGMAVLATDFLLDEKAPPRHKLRRTLTGLMILASILLLCVLFVHTQSMVRITYEGGAQTVSYTIGFKPHTYMGADCVAHCSNLSVKDCILQHTTFDEARIATCFGDEKIDFANFVYSIIYLALMGTIAAMVSLLMISRSLGRTKR